MTDTRPALFGAFFGKLLRRYRELNLKVIACSIIVTICGYAVLFMHESLIAFVLLVLTVAGTFSLVGYMKNSIVRSVSLGYEIGAVAIAVGALTYWSIAPN